MTLHLEGFELLEVIESKNLIKKKDRWVMSILFSMILEEISCELDVEKDGQRDMKWIIGEEWRCITSSKGANLILDERLR